MDKQPTIKQVLTDSNLLQAWYKVRANQGCAGIDRESISDFESGLMSSLALLRDEVIYSTYRPRPLFRIQVPKKKSQGLRSLSIPAVRDRVLQSATAINRHLTPKEFTMPTGANTACLMSDQARKLFIRELEKKLNAAILHPVSGLHLDYRRCLEHQVHHLAAVIQKREARYQAMVIR
ncbi:MAG: hypothetical protein D3923_04025 [Candidatus Electrothrix sp. AR3]|nr:hypothetical protein [Candidatus Electrothrix sp. AR3]